MMEDPDTTGNPVEVPNNGDTDTEEQKKNQEPAK